MKTVNVIAQVLIVIGALNWGFVAWFDFNLVTAIFGEDTWWTNLVYTLVGLAGLWGLYLISTVSRGTIGTGTRAHERREPTTRTTR